MGFYCTPHPMTCKLKLFMHNGSLLYHGDCSQGDRQVEWAGILWSLLSQFLLLKTAECLVSLPASPSGRGEKEKCCVYVCVCAKLLSLRTIGCLQFAGINNVVSCYILSVSVGQIINMVQRMNC